ncbi:hypothetical protein [Methylocella sp.]|jgi:hypothetical protein|uniref:hypothetical protein n=1 Tax=Methylocella sp. TaxID=1978226 RepID=UPI003C296C9F
MTMRSALQNSDIFGSILPGESWASWRVLLIAAMGERLKPSERAIFESLTGRPRGPQERVEELWAIIGRRGGKTRAVAVLAAYLAALVDWSDQLAPGERASLPIISASLAQASKALQYLDGIFDGVPALKKLVTAQTAETISLATRVDIECRPASFRTIRGGTFVACIADEVAFWRSDSSANPDVEILNAVRPSLATTGGMLACISSPYAQKGELHSAFKRDFGPNGDPLIIVAKAATCTMNPTLPQRVIDRAYATDAASASAEYGGDFRTDVESFVSQDVVNSCVETGCYERPPLAAVRYTAFIDPAGGSGQDSMTIAIAHREGDIAYLDCLREVKPPFSPDAVVSDFHSVMAAYHIHSVTGDRWGGEFVQEQFKKRGIRYETSEKPKSDIYKELLPLLNSRRADLIDHQKMISQLCNLERKTARGGRDSIDHPTGAHDDVANAAAGALVFATGGRRMMTITPEMLRRASMPGPATRRF